MQAHSDTQVRNTLRRILKLVIQISGMYSAYSGTNRTKGVAFKQTFTCSLDPSRDWTAVGRQ